MDSNAFEVLVIPACRAIGLGIAGGFLVLGLMKWFDFLAAPLGERGRPSGHRRGASPGLPANARSFPGTVGCPR